MWRIPRDLTRLSRTCVALALATLVIWGCESDNDPGGGTGPGDETGITSADFQAAKSCSTCHPVHFDEWKGSMHAYALTDPVFHEVRKAGQSRYAGALDQACVQCHSVVGNRSGETPWGPLALESLAEPVKEGVACDMCHVITSLHRMGNGGVTVTPGNTKFGTIRDPIETGAHESEYNSLYAESEYCGACHDFVTDRGLELETTYREWRDLGGGHLTGKTCNECHMPTYTGSATPGGPERTLHRHTFPGVDVALIDFPNRGEQMALVTALLKDALTLSVDGPASVSPNSTLDLTVRLLNDRTGHSVPSGVPFNREMWLRVVVTEPGGDTLYRSGTLDAADDLFGPDVDPDLFNAQATMLRADSVKTGATWEAVYLDNPSIRPGETRLVYYAVPIPNEVSGPLSVSVTLRFRSFAPSLLRSLGLNDLLDDLPTIDMESQSLTVNVE